MRKIAISQRVETISLYNEQRDCLDQRWTRLLSSVNLAAVPIPNSLDDPVSWLRSLKIEGVILSGGNDLSFLPDAVNVSEARDMTEMTLLSYLSKTQIPVLGVCRGMQMLGHYCGAQLIPVRNHAGTEHKIRLLSRQSKLLKAGFENIERVNSFHNWGIARKDFPTCLIPLAEDESGNIESFKHEIYPWYGIMWHPERKSLTEGKDKAFLKRFFLMG